MAEATAAGGGTTLTTIRERPTSLSTAGTDVLYKMTGNDDEAAGSWSGKGDRRRRRTKAKATEWERERERVRSQMKVVMNAFMQSARTPIAQGRDDKHSFSDMDEVEARGTPSPTVGKDERRESNWERARTIISAERKRHSVARSAAAQRKSQGRVEVIRGRRNVEMRDEIAEVRQKMARDWDERCRNLELTIQKDKCIRPGTAWRDSSSRELLISPASADDFSEGDHAADIPEPPPLPPPLSPLLLLKQTPYARRRGNRRRRGKQNAGSQENGAVKSSLKEKDRAVRKKSSHFKYKQPEEEGKVCDSCVVNRTEESRLDNEIEHRGRSSPPATDEGEPDKKPEGRRRRRHRRRSRGRKEKDTFTRLQSVETLQTNLHQAYNQQPSDTLFSPDKDFGQTIDKTSEMKSSLEQTSELLASQFVSQSHLEEMHPLLDPLGADVGRITNAYGMLGKTVLHAAKKIIDDVCENTDESQSSPMSSDKEISMTPSPLSFIERRKRFVHANKLCLKPEATRLGFAEEFREGYQFSVDAFEEFERNFGSKGFAKAALSARLREEERLPRLDAAEVAMWRLLEIEERINTAFSEQIDEVVGDLREQNLTYSAFKGAADKLIGTEGMDAGKVWKVVVLGKRLVEVFPLALRGLVEDYTEQLVEDTALEYVYDQGGMGKMMLEIDNNIEDSANGNEKAEKENSAASTSEVVQDAGMVHRQPMAGFGVDRGSTSTLPGFGSVSGPTGSDVSKLGGESWDELLQHLQLTLEPVNEEEEVDAEPVFESDNDSVYDTETQDGTDSELAEVVDTESESEIAKRRRRFSDGGANLQRIVLQQSHRRRLSEQGQQERSWFHHARMLGVFAAGAAVVGLSILKS